MEREDNPKRSHVDVQEQPQENNGQNQEKKVFQAPVIEKKNAWNKGSSGPTEPKKDDSSKPKGRAW